MGRWISVLIVTLLVTACQKHPADAVGGAGQTGKMAAINPRLAQATNRFGFELLHRVVASDDIGTVMISPASVAMALSMTHNGAAGATRTQMADVLAVGGFSLEELNAAHKQLREVLTDPKSEVALAIANSLWARQGLLFEDNFLSRNRDNFAAQIQNIDFTDPASANVINAWVNDKTRSKIPTIVDRISPETILFLINAIYFKGTWTYTFDPEHTYDGIFHHPSGDATRPLMRQENTFEYLDGNGFQAVRLPYGKSKRFAMYVFLPDGEKTARGFAQSVTDSSWKAWLEQFSDKRGTVHLPRFTVTNNFSLRDYLQVMGMRDAFSATDADFSGMISVPGENVFISEVKHKTFMQVNEEGTEAAAVTSVEVVVTSIREPEDTFELIVDRPFFCVIADRESGLILFMGTVDEYE